MSADLLRDIQYSNIIFDSAPIGMGIATFDGTLLKVNKSFCETIGYDEHDILNRKFTEFTHPDDLEINLKQNLRVISGEISKHSLEKRYIHKSGKIVHAIMTVTGLNNSNGEISYLLAQVLDISKRKKIEEAYRKSEQEFRDIFENAPISIAKVSSHGKILQVNKAFFENFGYTKEDLQNLSLKDISQPDDLAENLRLDKLLMEGKMENFTMEKRYKKKNGELIHGLLKVTLIKSEYEVYFLGQIVDITKIKKTERELEDKNISLNKINSELDQFVYRSSHDLKGPVTTIKGLLNLSKKENRNLPYVDQFEKSLYKLENVISDIVNFSQNSHLALTTEVVDINMLVSQIINDLEKSYVIQKIKINTTYIIKSDIVTDKKRLKILFKNLLSNSYQYSDPEKKNCIIKISIKSDNHTIHISIEDNGKGIGSEQMPNIFNMFYRGDESSEGSGLGLYIVKEIIDKMNGQLNISSEKGMGTTVQFTLPNNTISLNQDP